VKEIKVRVVVDGLHKIILNKTMIPLVIALRGVGRELRERQNVVI
jgi:hypothetical protein